MKEYNFEWSKLGRIYRKILDWFGLALAKDFHYCDAKWILSINHILEYIFTEETSDEILINLSRLLVKIDDGTKEVLIEDWMNKQSNNEPYLNILDRICPIILEEERKYILELSELNNCTCGDECKCK